MENKKGLLINEKMGEYEKKEGYASYNTIVNYYIKDLVLCNNIVNVDTSVYENIEGVEDFDDLEIYQYFLCNLTEFDKKFALECGLILSYSDLLDCDILMVDHWGTSWDYVLTDVKLFNTWEELEAYEKGEN